MIIQHNMTAANTSRQLGVTTGNLQKSTEKLSSGYRINRAGDDAAGLSISEKMRGQIRGLEQGSTNAQDGISLIQTAEGALNETHSIIQRMRELTVQAANDTNASEDRDAIKKEITQLTTEITRIANETEFNTKKLLNSNKVTFNFQVGANSNQKIDIDMKNMKASKLGLGTGVTGATKGLLDAKNNVSTHAVATAYLDVLDKALKDVSDFRSDLGAVQNRLEHTIANADNTAENLTAAESRIRDVNMADEMVKYSKNNILQQAAQSMLAQANQSTQGVLSIIG